MNNQSIPLINHFAGLITIEALDYSSNVLELAIENIVIQLNLTVVKRVSYTFKPIGKTLLYVLSESHLAIHTWPEYNLIHFDLVSCSVLTEDMVREAVRESFSPFVITKLSLNTCEV